MRAPLSSPFFVAKILTDEGGGEFTWEEVQADSTGALVKREGGRYGTATNPGVDVLSAGFAVNDYAIVRSADGNAGLTAELYPVFATAAPIVSSWKSPPVRAATTASGSAFANGDSVDGVTLATGDRILLKNQSTGGQNGIYVVQASGSPVRATDADTGAELLGATVAVLEGTVNADSVWMCTTNGPITIGTTSTFWKRLTSPLTTKGDIWAMSGTVSDTRLGYSAVNDEVLTVDTTADTGLKYAYPKLKRNADGCPSVTISPDNTDVTIKSLTIPATGIYMAFAMVFLRGNMSAGAPAFLSARIQGSGSSSMSATGAMKVLANGTLYESTVTIVSGPFTGVSGDAITLSARRGTGTWTFAAHTNNDEWFTLLRIG